MIFNTNSSLFSYELLSTFDANKQDRTEASPYLANPLNSCTVDSILFTADLTRQTLRFSTPIFCPNTELPFSLSLVSPLSMNKHNPYEDDIAAYYIKNKPSIEGLSVGRPQIQRNASSLGNIMGILDAVSTDLFAALYLFTTNSTDTPTLISTGGFLQCPEGGNITCRQEDMIVAVAASEISYPNGSFTVSIGQVDPFLAPFQQSFLNMFTVLRDAYHIDLGNIQPSNVLLNMSAFDARIHTDKNVLNISNQTKMLSCSWGLGCIVGKSWVNELSMSNPRLPVTVPSILPTGDAPAVIKVDYLCPHFRVKSTGSLITSVFIGTWTMYSAFFGIFGLVGPILEKRYGRKYRATARDLEYADKEDDCNEDSLPEANWHMNTISYGPNSLNQNNRGKS